MDLKVLSTTCSSRSGGIVHLYCFVVFHTNRIHFVATSFEWRFIENLWNWYSVHFYLLSTLQFSLSSLYKHTTVKKHSSFFIFLFLNALQHSPKCNHWTFLSHFVLHLFFFLRLPLCQGWWQTMFMSTKCECETETVRFAAMSVACCTVVTRCFH